MKNFWISYLFGVYFAFCPIGSLVFNVIDQNGTFRLFFFFFLILSALVLNIATRLESEQRIKKWPIVKKIITCLFLLFGILMKLL